MAKKPEPESAFSLRPASSEKLIPSMNEAIAYWDRLMHHNLTWGLVEGFIGGGRHDLFHSLLSIYAYVPGARVDIVEMITKAHAYQDVWDCLLDCQFRFRDFPVEVQDSIHDIQAICREGGATQVKGFSTPWSGPGDAEHQSLLLREHIIPHIPEDCFWRSLTLCELERWYPLISKNNGLPSLDSLSGDWREIRGFRRSNLYQWIRATLGVERAVSISCQALKYEVSECDTWLPLEDVLCVFSEGSLDRAIAYPAEANDSFRRGVGKMVMSLVLERDDAVDLLKSCRRESVSYWRKAGYLDQLTWYRVVGASSRQVDQLFSKDLGL